MTHAAIEPIMPITAASALTDAGAVQQAPAASFAQSLLHGVAAINDRLVNAEHLIVGAATNDGAPLHHVIYALEAARLDFELAMQVRGKLLEAYQQLANMQI